ncbi:MAG: fibronectin type III domain-containing protein [Candidatus Sumerlaeaceae bacterium]
MDFVSRIRIAARACALLLASLAGLCVAHSGDIAFLDHLYEARMSMKPDSSTTNPQTAVVLAREIGTLLSVVPNSKGETLLPRGTTCDSADLRDGKLTVRFSLPPSASQATLSPLQVETVNAVLVKYFAAPLQLNEVIVLGRMGAGNKSGAPEYRNLAEFVPPPPPLPPEEPNTNNGPEYQKLYAELQTAGAAANLNAIGQGPVGVGAQPAGALSGRTVFLGAGHGWTADGTGGWFLQRPLLLSMCEDYGNIDQVNFLAAYLFNAGATVVCARPLGYQTNEVILNETSAAVSYTGTWTSEVTTYSFGAGTTSRYANTAATETATATFTAGIAAAGFYPVYCYADHGADRTSGQLYKIRHSAGETQVRVNHRRVGRGWIWMGNYYFSQGSNSATGAVVVSNLQPPAGVTGKVIADAIRFGNGMGDIVRDGTISGKEREAENSRYWAQISQAPASVYDSSTTDQNDNVGAPSRLAAHMRRDDGQGYNGDIYLGFHSNAFNGTARGSCGLITNQTAVTNQPTWAALVSDTLDAQCAVEAANWDSTWGNYGLTTITSAYGEIGTGLNGEMCGTIVEIAFHDNTLDAALLRDPRVRTAAARAQYHAVAKYFNQFDGLTLNLLPETPQRVLAKNNGSGGVTVSWNPVAALAAPISSGAASGYFVYRSTDGLNFGNAVSVAGNASNSTTINGLAAGQITYFRVSAYNAGGESFPGEVVGVRVRNGVSEVLVVNGYDRIDNGNNVPVPIDRLRLRQNNSYDYVRPHGTALANAGKYFDNASNEAVINGLISLSSYPVVVWISGEESTRDKTFDSTERSLVQSFLTAGKGLFVSGSEIAYELDNQNIAKSFYNSTLRAAYVSTSANSYVATGNAGSIFEGLNIDFSPTSDTYNVDLADVISVANGSVAALTYAAGTQPPVDTFDTIGSWQDPNFAGQTNADISSTFQIVSTPLHQGTGSGDLFYVWGSGNRIRQFTSTSNTFPYASIFSVWIYGDNSGNALTPLLRDTSDVEIFSKSSIVLNFTGWQQFTWNIPVDAAIETLTAAGGDGIITPNAAIKFDGFLLDKVGAAASGHVYIDDATYDSGVTGGGNAGIQYAGTYKAVTLGFPFEAIGSQSTRNSVMLAVMNFFSNPTTVRDWQMY